MAGFFITIWLTQLERLAPFNKITELTQDLFSGFFNRKTK